MPDDHALTPAPSMTLTPRAAERIAELVAKPENAGLTLRLAVEGGGCSGFSYGFSFDDEQRPDDIAIGRDGATLLVDEVSYAYLAGAEVDFVDEMVGASFIVRNPNATQSCGCGNSFSVG